MTVAPVAVDAPRVAPALGGLLPVADIVEASDPHIAFGIEYQSWLCEEGGYTSGCVDAPAGVPIDDPKLFGGSHIVTGVPVVVYAGIECDLFGAPYTQQSADRLAGSEDRLVAGAFYQHALIGAWNAGTAPVVLTETVTEDNIVEAIGALEQYAGEMYAGQPVLHMNRHMATLAVAAQAAFPGLDGSLTTAQGTPIANSAGYPDGVIFITGAVHLWRTAVATYQAPNTSTNTSVALSERTYVLSTDCLLAVAGSDELPTPEPPDMVVTYVSPTTVTGGTTAILTIGGTGFTDEATVTIDGDPVEIVSQSPTQLVVRWSVPPQAPPPAPVDVVVTQGDDTGTLTVTVNPGGVVAPTITAVNPDTGSTAGGVTVTITGTGFEE